MTRAGLFRASLILIGSTWAWAEQPVGLIVSGPDAKILRPGRTTEMDAAPGQELFAKDTILAGAAPVTFSFCPDSSMQTLAASSRIELSASAVPARHATASQAIHSCLLPEMERFPLAPQGERHSAPRDGTLAEQIEHLSAEEARGLRAQLGPIEAALQSAASDPSNSRVVLLSARADALAKAGLVGEAEAQYDAIFREFPGAAWTQHVAAKLQSDWEKQQAELALASRGVTVTAVADAASEIQQTYAVVIGISHYNKKSDIPWLRYADADARSFAEFLHTPRGGGLTLCTDEKPTNCQVQLLVNENATLANITRVFDSFVRDHANKSNALIVFIAAHGADPGMELNLKSNSPIDPRPVILTYDSDYNEAKVSGYIMEELRDSIARQGLVYGRAVLFADVCHAGDIGPIAGTGKVQPAVEQVFHLNKGTVGLFMASQAKDDAYESPLFGGGHGAFSYYVLRGMNDPSQTGEKLDFATLLDSIRAGVRKVTSQQQHPTGVASDEGMAVLDHLSLGGMTDLGDAKPITDPKLLRRPRGMRSSAPKTTTEETPAASSDEFIAAIRAGRLRSDEGPDSAQELLARMEPAEPADLLAAHRDQLRVALENRGQQSILTYLRGDQVRQPAAEFDRCAKDFAAALAIAPAVLYDRSRMVFCSARYEIAPERSTNPDYGGAVGRFEQAIALDPNRSYAYNGLGIAYLEQAAKDARFFERAVNAFRDAIRFSPYWPYPWHNLALTYEQMGRYAEAIGAYQTAMKQSPDYSYLPLNLGLLYQRLNRTAEAESMFRRALKIANDASANKVRPGIPGQWTERAEIYNALGNLQSDRGDAKDAQASYSAALEDDPLSKSARHDYALFLSRNGPSSEAEELWRGVLENDPNFTPSRLALAAYLARERRYQDAAREYAAALHPGDDLPGIRLSAAAVYSALKQYDAAIEVLQPALAAQPDNPNLLERMADLYASAGRGKSARALYTSAENGYTAHTDKKRVAQKRASAASSPD